MKKNLVITLCTSILFFLSTCSMDIKIDQDIKNLWSSLESQQQKNILDYSLATNSIDTIQHIIRFELTKEFFNQVAEKIIEPSQYKASGYILRHHFLINKDRSLVFTTNELMQLIKKGLTTYCMHRTEVTVDLLTWLGLNNNSLCAAWNPIYDSIAIVTANQLKKNYTFFIFPTKNSYMMYKHQENNSLWKIPFNTRASKSFNYEKELRNYSQSNPFITFTYAMQNSSSFKGMAWSKDGNLLLIDFADDITQERLALIFDIKINKLIGEFKFGGQWKQKIC